MACLSKYSFYILYAVKQMSQTNEMLEISGKLW